MTTMIEDNFAKSNSSDAISLLVFIKTSLVTQFVIWPQMIWVSSESFFQHGISLEIFYPYWVMRIRRCIPWGTDETRSIAKRNIFVSTEKWHGHAIHDYRVFFNIFFPTTLLCVWVCNFQVACRGRLLVVAWGNGRRSKEPNRWQSRPGSTIPIA